MKTKLISGLLFGTLLAIPSVNRAAPPANDSFANAINIGTANPATSTGTADEASAELDEPFVRSTVFFDEFDQPYFESYGSTIWWKWTCPAGNERLVSINTNLSTEEGFDEFTSETKQVPMDTLLMIFSGPDLATLTPVAESGDKAGVVTSEVIFVATPGTTYHIRVDSENPFLFNSSVNVNISSQGSPTTADAHVAWGKARLTYTGDWTVLGGDAPPFFTAAALTAAENHFNQALHLTKTHAEANLLKAVVTLIKLQKEPAFVGLLSQLGIDDESADPELPDYVVPSAVDGKRLFAANASTTLGIDYLKTVARPRLVASLAMLEKVTSATFLSTLNDSNRFTDSLYIDYGDVLLLRSGSKALLALLDLIESYNLIASLQDISDLDSDGLLNGQKVADTLGNLLKFSGTDKRASLKANLQAAISLYKQASTHVMSKRPPLRDENHLVPLLENKSGEPKRVADLDKLNKSIGGAAVVEDGWSFNIGKILTGTLSLRDLAPNFKGNRIIKSSVPKSDLGGALPGAGVTKVENYLRDNDFLWEDLITLGVVVADGQAQFGSVSNPGGMFQPGQSFSISATPARGYVFAGWKSRDQTMSVLSPYIFPVIREYTLMAQFAEDNRDNDRDGLSNYDEVRLGTNASNIDSDGDGWPDGLDPSPLTSDAREFIVSQNFSGVSLNLPVGKVISISGQPAGVTYDVINERLIGRPTFLGAGVTASKTFTIKATVKPLTGPNFTLEIKFTVEPLGGKLFGTFNGLADQGSTLNAGLGGSLSVTVTNSGAVSGKLIMNGFTYTFPAKVNLETVPAPFAPATCILPGIKPKSTAPNVFIRLTIDANTGRMIGTASPAETLGGIGVIALGAERLAIPAPALVGTYNSLLNPNNHMGDLAYPQGDGFSTLKVTGTGTVTWGGKLADGTVITGGTTLSSNGDAPLHLMLYANRGSIQGWTRVNAGRHTAPNALTWTKKNILTTTRSYKDGFPSAHSVAMDGSLYNPATALFTQFGLAVGTSNTVIRFSEGNLDAPFSQPFQIIAPSVVKPPLVSSTLNPNKIVLSGITVGTGLFTGSFTIGTPARKADFSGIVVPHLSRGGGYFLLPTSSLATSPTLSGLMDIKAD